MDDNTFNSLENICVDWLSSNLGSVCYIQSNVKNILKFRNEKIFLPECVGNKLFVELNNRGYLTNLVMSLFDPKAIRLTAVTISCGMCVGLEGWQILKMHKLRSIVIAGLDGIPLSHISQFFCDPAFDDLQSLSLVNVRLTDSNLIESYPVKRWECKRKYLPFWTPLCARKDFHTDRLSDDPLKKRSSCYCKRRMPIQFPGNEKLSLPESVKCFDVSGTNIHQSQLPATLQNFKQLEKFNISSCNEILSIDFLVNFSSSLQHLIMYNAKVIYSEDIVNSLLLLKQLRFLDVSSPTVIDNTYINKLLVDSTFCPLLEGIDITKHSLVDYKSLHQFYLYHPEIKFIGMYFIPVEVRVKLKIPNCKFTSCKYYGDLIEALKRYATKRDLFLYTLQILQEIITRERKMDEVMCSQAIVENLLRGLTVYRKDVVIQTSGVMIATTFAEANFPARVMQLISKNIVEAFILCEEVQNTELLQIDFQTSSFTWLLEYESSAKTSYDKITVIRIALRSLGYGERRMHEPALKLCSILFNKISKDEASLFIKPSYFKLLVRHIESKVDFGGLPLFRDYAVDSVIYAFSTLWSLTDESETGCDMLLRKTSLRRLKDYCRLFPQRKIREKIFGILSNLADVPSIREHFIYEDMLTFLLDNIYSDVSLISILSCITLGHVVVDRAMIWDESRLQAPYLQRCIGKMVLKWDHPSDEIIRYRSFKSFVEWLDASDKMDLQLLALWLLKVVTESDVERYCDMFLEYGILGYIIDIYKLRRKPMLFVLSCDILEILANHFKFRSVKRLIKKVDSSVTGKRNFSKKELLS